MNMQQRLEEHRETKVLVADSRWTRKTKLDFHIFLPVLTQIEMGGKQDQHGHKTEKEVDYIQTEDENGNTTIYFGMIPFRF